MVDSSGYLALSTWVIISATLIGGIYNLIFYLTHTAKGHRTLTGAIKALIVGCVAGGAIGLMLTGKAKIVDGIVGALGSIASYLGETARLRKTVNAGRFITAAVGGFASGAITGKISALLKLGNYTAAASSIIGAFVGGYISAW